MAKDKTKKSAPIADESARTSRPYETLDEIKLGHEARDPVTGLTGIINLKAELLSGSVQYSIQPQGDGKTMPEAYYVDDFLLEYVGEGVRSARMPEPDPHANFKLGVKLKHRPSGLTGIAVQRVTYLNGCVGYAIQPHLNDSREKVLIDGAPRPETFDYKSFDLVDEGQSDPAQKTPAKRSSTGGPTLKAPSRKVPR